MTNVFAQMRIIRIAEFAKNVHNIAPNVITIGHVQNVSTIYKQTMWVSVVVTTELP